jgi:hypothetical protein
VSLFEVIVQYPFIVSFLCAELFFLITRSSDIIIVCKRETQRNQQEKSSVRKCLIRSLLLEALVFVPASVALMLITVFPLISDRLPLIGEKEVAWYGVIGVIAYGFPFATIRRVVTKMALNTLKEFALLTQKNEVHDNANTESSNKRDKE